MYSVMIVDDEILARAGIKSLISWEEHGLEIVGKSDNGSKALALAKKLRPDIIITDIKMPVMDGIELVKAVKEVKLDTKFILLSAHDDFELVKQAMKLGVEDYILKLQMEADSLLQVLKSVCESIDKERDTMQKRIIIEKQLNDSISILKEDFLKSMIKGGNIDEEELEEKFSLYEIPLLENNLLCMLVRLEKFNEMENGTTVLKASIRDIIKEIASDYGQGEVFYLEEGICVVLCSLAAGKSLERQQHLISRLTNGIKEYLKDSMDVDVSMGVSAIHQKYRELPVAFQEARKALSSSAAYKLGSILHYDAAKELGDLAESPFEKEINEIESSLRKFNVEKIEEGFEELVQKIQKSNGVEKSYLAGACYIMVFIIKTFLNDNHLASLWQEERKSHEEIDKLNTIEDYAVWFDTLKYRLIHFIEPEIGSNVLIMKAKQFINQHYRGNLPLDAVAKHLSLSPSYFSRFFSKETGQSFTDYVTGLRIEYAKKLLKSGQYKIYEVAELAGYESTHYFSRIFKKVTGESPLDYKSKTLG